MLQMRIYLFSGRVYVWPNTQGRDNGSHPLLNWMRLLCFTNITRESRDNMPAVMYDNSKRNDMIIKCLCRRRWARFFKKIIS